MNTKADQTAEREAFEAWYCADAERQGMPMRDGIANLREGNHYGEHRVMLNGKWEGWQGARATPTASTAPAEWSTIDHKTGKVWDANMQRAYEEGFAVGQASPPPAAAQADAVTFPQWWKTKGQFTTISAEEPEDFELEKAIARAAWRAAISTKGAAQADVVSGIWRAAMTLANNLCVQTSDRYNGDDATAEADAAAECARQIRGYLEPSAEELSHLLNEAGVTR